MFFIETKQNVFYKKFESLTFYCPGAVNASFIHHKTLSKANSNNNIHVYKRKVQNCFVMAIRAIIFTEEID